MPGIFRDGALKIHALTGFKRGLAIAAALFLFLNAAPGGLTAEDVRPGGAVPGKKPVTVYSDRMEAGRDDKTAVFKGNVMAEGDFTLCSEELSISYGADKEIDEITAKGNVRIFQGEKTSSSDGAVYDREKRMIVLTGGASVRQCEDTIRGEKITVYIDSDRAVVESGGGHRVMAVLTPDKKCAPAGKAAAGVKGDRPERGESVEARCQRPR
ncbi:MAG: hypothetical protein HZB83_08120 [Deltaproteobacteria bacterium]|nr:hypothetical protein [Deltaproteobacteria bacterium]